MSSNTDLSPHPDTPKQQPSLKKKNGGISWIIFLIPFVLGNWFLLSRMTKGLDTGGFFAIGGFFGSLMALALIDLMAVLVFMYIQQSHGLHGTSRNISYVIIAISILAVIFSLIVMASLFNLEL